MKLQKLFCKTCTVMLLVTNELCLHHTVSIAAIELMSAPS